MASGFGVKGNKGRCYDFWMGFSKCMSDADHPSACAPLREDYLECLHHRKEFDRINEVVREQVKQRARIKAERKAAFEHKWFGTPLPEGTHGGH